MTPQADLTTIERARDGDADALEALIAGVWPQAYRIAAAIVRDRTLAEDAAQEACASMIRGLPGLRDVRTFEGWWRRIAGNRALDAARRRADVAPIEAASDVRIESDDAALIDLHDAIAALPLQQRAAVVLHYYAGLSSAEIAAVLRVPSATVRFHLMLARRALRNLLSLEPEVYSHAR